MNITDNELVERLQKGDVGAFDMIYGRYSMKLYRFGLKYLRSTEEAEELVQSVFLKVWEHRKKINKELSLKSFLFTMTYNDICKIFRARNYLQKFISYTLSRNSHSTNDTEERIEYQSILKQVQQIINKLPEKQKIVFLKSRQDGKSTKEIAGELGLTVGTVDNYISGSLKYIRTLMNKEDLPVILLFSLFYHYL